MAGFRYCGDYVRLIERKLGIKFEIREVDSWSTSVKDTKAREKDVWSAVALTPERKKFMEFSAFHIDSPAVISVRNTTTWSLSMRELKVSGSMSSKTTRSARFFVKVTRIFRLRTCRIRRPV